MLKLTSRFVLEVLPYLLSTLIAAVLVPGILYSLITIALPRGLLFTGSRNGGDSHAKHLRSWRERSRLDPSGA